MRPTPWHVALTLSATAHVAAFGIVAARSAQAPRAGDAAARPVVLEVVAAATAPDAPTARQAPVPVPPATPPRITAAQQSTRAPAAALPPAEAPESAPPRPHRTAARVAFAEAVPHAAGAPGPAALDALVERLDAAGAGAAPSSGAAADSAPAQPVGGANAPPPYPLVARRRGWEGRVLLEVRVGADGSVGRVRVARSSGHSVLDEAARAAVEHWTFTPARAGGVTLASTVGVPVIFRLDDDRPGS